MKKNPSYISFLKENRTKSQAEAIYNQRIKDSEEVFNKFSDEFIERVCPVCGEQEYTPLEKFNGQYGVVSCVKCSSNYVNPSPNLDALDYYYNNCECNKQLGSLLKERVGKKGVILSERTTLVLEIIRKLLEDKSKIRILDVGCNSGHFLYELKQALIEENYASKVSLEGIDIDMVAVQNPVDNEIRLHHSSAEEFVSKSEHKFDLILHFELIEHLHNPYEFCCALYKLLNDKGLMYFHTPNALGLDNTVLSYNDFRPLAHGIFPPMHLNAFTTQNVTHFLIRCGFNVNKIETPGNFDVDIVRQFGSKESKLSVINEISDEKSLAIFQYVLRELGSSSHLAVLASK
jgi:2-polyprenyl-3-methyl-5-hydroxy-6-metoxy-1,4-benzoquinol methylase